MGREFAPVSAIVPCYRCAGTIGRAVESIAGQTLRPAEVLLIDDASGDRTWEEIERLRLEHEPGWIKCIALRENEGPSAARNAGWNAAIQPLIAFLDADDAWHPRKIELQHDLMRAHPEIAVCAHRARRIRGPVRAQAIDAPPAVRHIDRSRLLLGNRFVTPSVMLRRELPFRFAEDRRYMEDHLLWLQIACAGHRIAVLDAELAFLYKAPFGEKGLSSHLWRMETAELDNYRRLLDSRTIGAPAALALWIWSLAKFARRLVYAAIPSFRDRLEPR